MSFERSTRAVTVQMEHMENQGSNEGVQRHPQHNHMTLDGRRRPRNNQNQDTPANSEDQWNDWTSTWRRMGNKGESKPVTMTGTVTRGKRRGEVVDVQLDLTTRELLEISQVEESIPSPTVSTPGSLPSSGLQPKSSACKCGIEAGPHILLLSIIAFPCIFIASILVSFYFGALTWQNIFSHFYDERTIWHRIFICPILVLTFPLFILIFTLGIALYAAFIQLRWSFPDWKIEVTSLEKGFYGWLCGAMGMEDCSPYTVIELFSGEDSEHHQIQHDGRVEVSYSQDNASNRHSSRTPRSSSLPGTSGHHPMSRIESTM